MTVDRVRIGWLVETLDDSQTAEILGCSRRTVIRARQEMGIPPAQSHRPQVNGGPCSVAGCGGTAHAAGVCQSHYSRLHRTGSVWADVPLGKPGWGPTLAERAVEVAP